MPSKIHGAKARQSALSFASKVKKPNFSSPHTPSAVKKPQSHLSQNAPVSVYLSPSQEKLETIHAFSLPSNSEEVKQAQELSQNALKRYYTNCVLGSRITPPVHQDVLNQEEKILRHFDLSSQYGPCIGISRLNRWKRAHRLTLAPPIEVLAVALRMENEKGGIEKIRDTRMSYLDDFLSTRRTDE